MPAYNYFFILFYIYFYVWIVKICKNIYGYWIYFANKNLYIWNKSISTYYRTVATFVLNFTEHVRLFFCFHKKIYFNLCSINVEYMRRRIIIIYYQIDQSVQSNLLDFLSAGIDDKLALPYILPRSKKVICWNVFVQKYILSHINVIMMPINLRIDNWSICFLRIESTLGFFHIITLHILWERSAIPPLTHMRVSYTERSLSETNFRRYELINSWKFPK